MSKNEKSGQEEIDHLVANMESVYFDDDGNPRAETEALSKSGGSDEDEE